jgi:hypothetical protein
MARVLPAERRVNPVWLCPASDPTITRNLTLWEKFVFVHIAIGRISVGSNPASVFANSHLSPRLARLEQTFARSPDFID